MSGHGKTPTWPRIAHTTDGAEYHIRPIRPDDVARERDFIISLSPESRFQRFFHAMGEPPEALIVQLVDVDPHARMALVAVIGATAAERIIGVARYAADPDGRDCEFAVAVSDAWQCRGIGTTLTRMLFDYAAHEGFHTIYGQVLATNQRMLELAELLELVVEPPLPGDSTARAARRLN